jgi:methionyl-tRNA formyltransferase
MVSVGKNDLKGFGRVALFGDACGLPMTLEAVAPTRVACMVAASVRPNDLASVVRLGATHGLPVLVQPKFQSVDYLQFVAALRGFAPDALVCNSYSMLVRPDILACVSGNAVNMHAALLPRNRGPNPIQWALIHGERETGVTLHYMSETIDGGDVIAQERVAIGDEDTWVTLRARLEVATRQLIGQHLTRFLAGESSRRPQDERMASTNTRLTPDSPRIELDRMDDRQVFNLIRGQVHPLKGAYVETSEGRVHFAGYVPLVSIPELRARYE